MKFLLSITILSMVLVQVLCESHMATNFPYRTLPPTKSTEKPYGTIKTGTHKFVKHPNTPFSRVIPTTWERVSRETEKPGVTEEPLTPPGHGGIPTGTVKWRKVTPQLNAGYMFDDEYKTSEGESKVFYVQYTDNKLILGAIALGVVATLLVMLVTLFAMKSFMKSAEKSIRHRVHEISSTPLPWNYMHKQKLDANLLV